MQQTSLGKEAHEEELVQPAALEKEEYQDKSMQQATLEKVQHAALEKEGTRTMTNHCNRQH